MTGNLSIDHFLSANQMKSHGFSNDTHYAKQSLQAGDTEEITIMVKDEEGDFPDPHSYITKRGNKYIVVSQ